MKSLLKVRLLSVIILIISCFITISCSEDDNRINPEIYEVTSGEIFAGDEVTVDGLGFDDVETILFGETSVSFEFTETGSIVFVVPEETLSGSELITLIFADNFKLTKDIIITARAPVFENISTRIAEPGEVITINGASFDNIEYVRINGKDVDALQFTQTSMTFKVPFDVTNSMGAITFANSKGTYTSDFVFYIGTEIIISDFDENENGWNAVYAANDNADLDVSGVGDRNPLPINENYMKLVFKDPGSGWGAGSQVNFLGSLTASVEQIILVADFHSNSTTVSYKFQIEVTGQPEWEYEFNAKEYNEWTEIITPLLDFDNGESDPIDITAIKRIKIQGDRQEAELNWDNVRFIELSN